MFLVWQQGRQMDGGQATDFGFRRDIGDLFNEHPNNTFLLKVSYWFNP
jgi:hypothetical protein